MSELTYINGLVADLTRPVWIIHVRPSTMSVAICQKVNYNRQMVTKRKWECYVESVDGRSFLWVWEANPGSRPRTRPRSSPNYAMGAVCVEVKHAASTEGVVLVFQAVLGTDYWSIGTNRQVFFFMGLRLGFRATQRQAHDCHMLYTSFLLSEHTIWWIIVPLKAKVEMVLFY